MINAFINIPNLLSSCFCVVDSKVGKDKSLRVKVVKIHPLETAPEDQPPKKMEGACDSPSSDKENASQENQKKEQPKEEENSRRESLCK